MKRSLALALCALIVPVLATSAIAEEKPTSFTELQSASSSFQVDVSQKQATTSQLATLTFYPTRAAFDAVALGIPTETFETGLAGPGAIVGCSVDPISTANTGTCFPTGSLIDGFTYGSTGGTGLVILGSGVVGNPSVILGADLFAESGELTFSDPNVFAVGFDLFEPFGTPVTLTVFSANGLEGQLTIPPGGGFFGVTSDMPITSIGVGVVNQAGGGELIDNLSFGDACPCLASNSLFSDLVNGVVPVAQFLECRDEEDNTGVLVLQTDGTIVGAASGTKGGRPPMCGTQVYNDPPNFIEITASQDATCRALLSTICPD